MLFNHDSGLIQSILTIDTTIAPPLGGQNSLQIIGTGGLLLPAGTTAQRPSSPVAGTSRFNTTTSHLETFDGVSWISHGDGTVTSITVASDNAALTVAQPTVTTSGTVTLSLDQTLVNFAASTPPATGGAVVRLANDTFISRDFLGTAPVIVTNGDGVDGSPTISVNAELTGLSTPSTTGVVARTATGTYAQRTITGTTDVASGSITVTNGAGVAGDPTIAFAPGTALTSIINVGNGVVVKTAADTYTNRTLIGTGSIVVTNGDGIAGNPTISYTAGANLAGLEALNGVGYVVQTGVATFANRTITGSTNTATGSINITEGTAAASDTAISFTPGVELGGVAALATSGMVARTGAGSYTGRTITGSTNSAGTVSLTNGDGVAGNPTIAFTAGTELDALANTSATGVIVRTGAGAYTGHNIVGGGSISVTNGTGGSVGDITVSYTAGANLDALGALAGTGFITQTAAGTFAERTIAGTASNIVVTNGDGISGNPTVDLASVSQASSGTFSKVTLDGFGRVVGNTAVTTADITTLVDSTYINASGDTMTGVLNMGGFDLSNLPAAPGSGTSAVTKNYVDALTSGLSWKQSVKAATTGNVTLSGEQTVDGVALVGGDRVLVRAQTSAVDNGVYIVSASAWARSEDFDAPQESRAASMFVEQGSTLADTAWTQTSEVVTIGTTAMNFVQFAGAGSYVAGTGLSLIGNAFSITAPVSTSLGGTGLTTTGTSGQLLGVGAGGLEYKTVTAGSGVSVTQSAGDITVANTGVLSNAAGAGISITNATGDSTITNTGVLVVTTSGVGISANTASGTVTIANTGVTSAVAGTGVAVDASTGAVTFSNTGVLSLTAAGTGVAVDASTGNITITGNAVTAVTPGAGISASITAGNLSIANTGVLSVSSATASLDVALAAGAVTLTNNGITSAVAGSGISVSNAGVGASTISNTGVLSNIGGTGISVDNATGNSTISTSAVLSLVAGTGVTLSGVNATGITVTNNGVVGLAGTTNQVSVSGTAGGTFTVGLPASVTIDTALTVTGLGADKVLRTGAAGVVEGVTLTDGQFLIGATGAAPAAASLTAGTGITVTNSPNGITVAVSGGVAVNSVTGAVAVGSTTALTVTNTGTAAAPIITYGVDAGLESLAALGTVGLVVQSVADTFVTRSLVAGTGVSISDLTGAGGDITIANTGVTSVGLSLPGMFTVAGSPVTTTGTLSATLASQSAATVFAGPVSGGSAAPTFRALVPSDLGLNLYKENSASAVAPSATGANSIALGSASVAALSGQVAHAAGQFGSAGDAQAIEMVLRGITTDDTTGELFLDGDALKAAMPANSAWNFMVQVIGRRTDDVGGAAAYRFDGIITKDAANSSTAFIGTPSKNVLGETQMAWDAAVLADATNGALKVTVTGEAAKTIRWVATVRATQVTN